MDIKIIANRPNDIFKGKIITNLIITIPASIIANVFFLYRIKV